MSDKSRSRDDERISSDMTSPEEPKVLRSALIGQQGTPPARRGFLRGLLGVGGGAAATLSACGGDSGGDKTSSSRTSTTNSQCTQTYHPAFAHSSPITSVDLAPDGNHVATASGDGLVKVWSVSTGQVVTTYKGHNGSVNSVRFSPDGLTIVSGGADATVQVWRWSDGTLIRKYLGHKSAVTAAVLSPDGSTVASGCSSPGIDIWNASTGVALRTGFAPLGLGYVTASIAFSIDGKRILVGCKPAVTFYYDLANDKLITMWGSGSSAGVPCVGFDPSGVQIATCDSGLARLERADSGGWLRDVSISGSATTFDFAPTTAQIAVGTDQGMVYIASIATGAPTQNIQAASSSVSSLAYNADGTRIVCGSSDKTAKVWSSATLTAIAALVDSTLPVVSTSSTNCSHANANLCSCDTVCTCDTVCSCNTVCSCDTVCTSHATCSCDSDHYWYPN